MIVCVLFCVLRSMIFYPFFFPLGSFICSRDITLQGSEDWIGKPQLEVTFEVLLPFSIGKEKGPIVRFLSAIDFCIHGVFCELLD